MIIHKLIAEPDFDIEKLMYLLDLDHKIKFRKHNIFSHPLPYHVMGIFQSKYGSPESLRTISSTREEFLNDLKNMNFHELEDYVFNELYLGFSKTTSDTDIELFEKEFRNVKIQKIKELGDPVRTLMECYINDSDLFSLCDKSISILYKMRFE